MKVMSDKVVSARAMKCEDTPGCIQSALEVLGDKWSPLLLKELAETGEQKFSELEVALRTLSPRTLSQRLKMLQGQDIVTRTAYSVHPPRYSYRLTDKGRDLVKVLRAMADWGEKYYS